MARLPLLLAAGLLLAAPSASRATTDAALYIHGRFHVQGGSLEGARVTISRGARTMEVLTDDIRRISLRLDLQSTWTISFEREGCLTKQLFFDTRMSDEALANAPFIFRFTVTLEPVPSLIDVHYIGPVGYVRFYSGAGDFSYDTDYRMTHRIRANDEVTASLRTPSVSAHRDRRERHFVQPFIDPTREMERTGGMRLSGPAAELIASASVIDGSNTAEGISSVSSSPQVPLDPMQVQRSVIVEQERVITITRMMTNGRLTEYRRIMHSNGTVLHFKNASNCSYKEYMRAVGE